MLIILSPAKSMDMNPVANAPAGTKPQFQSDAEFIASKMQEYSRDQLQILLQISNKLTDINYERYRDFGLNTTLAKPALLAYTGNVFQHINPSTFTDKDFRYAQDHLRIISTLYGLVKPLDLIKAYRIAFKIKLKGIEEKDLYEYWLPKLTTPLIEATQKSGNILINLASLDVLGALDMKMLNEKVRVITPEFKEFRNGKYETIRTYAKMARGEMTRYILLNRIEEPEKIKQFEWDAFRFNAKLSDNTNYIFVKS